MYDVEKITWPEIAAEEDYHGPQPGMAVYELAYIVNGQWTPEKAGDEAWRQVVRAARFVPCFCLACLCLSCLCLSCL